MTKVEKRKREEMFVRDVSLGWALNPVTGVLVRRGEDTDTQREKGHGKIVAHRD